MLRLHSLSHTKNTKLHTKLLNSSSSSSSSSSTFVLLRSIMPSKFFFNTTTTTANPLLPSFSTSFSSLSSSSLSPSFLYAAADAAQNYRLLRSSHRVILCSNSAKPVSNSNSVPFSLSTSSRSYSAYPNIRSPVSSELTTLESQRLDMLMKKLEVLKITDYEPMPGQYSKLLCPKCGGGQSREKSFSLNIADDGNTAAYICHRGKCGWNGIVKGAADVSPTLRKSKIITKAIPKTITENSLKLEPIGDTLLGYFSERMITASTLKRNYVLQKTYGDQVVIAFTYRRDGTLVNCKYRDVNKRFWQEADTEKIVYGLDDIKNASDIIIVEGEMDKLAMEEAGFLNCVSVPDGAPCKVSTKELPSPDEDTKYQYLWNCREYFKKASRIILATDADEPGQALAEEIARRLGRERCWRVKWPKKNEREVFKDANEVLMYMGPEALKETIENAELYPIQGLFNFRDYFPEIDAYYHRVVGDEFGVSTGWRCLDEYYNIVPGELTIVSGIPNSGKSEWIDALLCNLNQSVGWKFALCSMENKVRDHARKLLEKHIKKPFFTVRYGETVERMTVEEFEKGKEWLDETFHLIRCENDSLPNIKWVLERAKSAVLRYGIRGLVIDPYNELDHQRHNSMTETEYVSQMLTMVKRFAQHHSCHVWFVAHPKQLQNWNGDPPNLYDISGSAHFINKCDNGVIVHRNRDPEAGPIDQVQIFVRKVRNKVAGTVGDSFLTYNRVTGEFVDLSS